MIPKLYGNCCNLISTNTCSFRIFKEKMMLELTMLDIMKVERKEYLLSYHCMFLFQYS